MDESNVSSVNAEPVVNVDPQQTTVIEPVNAGNGDVAPPQTGEKPTQTPEQNAEFARVRREAETKARDTVIAEMGYMYGDIPITTYAQYQQALQEIEQAKQDAELQSQGKDPELYRKLQELEDFKNNVTREKNLSEQEQRLASDEKVGKFYKEWEKEVKELANTFQGELKGNLDVAFTLLAKEKLAEMATQQPNLEEVKKQGVKEYIESLRKGNVPIEAGGQTPIVIPKTNNSWASARQASQEFLKQMKE